MHPAIGSAHLIGIGGAGMRALAEVFAASGCRVSGSDAVDPDPGGSLGRRGVRLYRGHGEHQVPSDAGVVVYSSAIPSSNPERVAATRMGLRELSYAEMLGLLMQGQLGVGIAGTHGKSTTTAMTAQVLSGAGLEPTCLVGAPVLNWRRGSGIAGGGEWVVAECCEYRRNFLCTKPKAAAILGIEPDHFDCYKTAAALDGAFRAFARQVAGSGIVVANGDCARSMACVEGIDAAVRTISLRQGTDWRAADLRGDDGYYRFRVFYRGTYHSEIKLGIPGRHSVFNALAAVALADWAGVSPSIIREALAEFRGLGRRFEVLGNWRGVTLVDDYAHHPTAVRATLATAREVFGARRIWCVFQPHQVSRTAALLDEFAASFEQSDRVMVNDIYQARETASDPDGCGEQIGHKAVINAEHLAERIAARGVVVLAGHRREQIVETLQQELQPGDVLITIGAGDVGNLCDAFLERLPRDHHTR